MDGAGPRPDREARGEGAPDREVPDNEALDGGTPDRRFPDNEALDGETGPGGDPVCWAHLVCPECGSVTTEGHRANCSLA